jgi:hypothetical protein
MTVFQTGLKKTPENAKRPWGEPMAFNVRSLAVYFIV